MKIIKEIWDFKKGDKFKLNTGAEFEVVVSMKEYNRFMAICIKDENESKIGTNLTDTIFDGLNIKYIDDYIEYAEDEKGKEYKLERIEKKDEYESIKSSLNEIVDEIKLFVKMAGNPTKEDYKESFEFAKKRTLEILKDENTSIEEKQKWIENYKELEKAYKEVIKDNEEIEDMINELEEE